MYPEPLSFFPSLAVPFHRAPLFSPFLPPSFHLRAERGALPTPARVNARGASRCAKHNSDNPKSGFTCPNGPVSTAKNPPLECTLEKRPAGSIKQDRTAGKNCHPCKLEMVWSTGLYKLPRTDFYSH